MVTKSRRVSYLFESEIVPKSDWHFWQPIWNHTEEDAVRIYCQALGNRVLFFKVIKFRLRLVKEFQCRSYDSMTAYTSMFFCVTWCCRWVFGKKWIPEPSVNFFICAVMESKIFAAQALMTILELIGSTMAKVYLLTNEQINQFFDLFLISCPIIYENRYLIPIRMALDVHKSL